MKIELEKNEYILEKNYRDAFDLEEVTNKYTDYFENYDYIVGDWAYGKLRLKGFYSKNNKKVGEINNINFADEYIKKYCAYDCKYFILKKNKKVSDSDEWNNNNKEK